MPTILEHIAKGALKEAIELAIRQFPAMSELLLISARFNNVSRQFNLGLIDHAAFNRDVAQISFSLQETLGDKISTHLTPTTQPVQPTMNTNPLVEFDDLYRDGIKRDLHGSNFNEANVRQYCQTLGRIFNMVQQFDTLLDPLNNSNYKYGSSAVKNDILKSVLETLVNRHDGFRGRLETQVNSQNNEVTYQETIASFFRNPTTANWKACKTSVDERVADTSLYGPQVRTAWANWSTKVDALDDFDLGFKMARGTQMHSDLLVWLQSNLGIKNFNYA